MVLILISILLKIQCLLRQQVLNLQKGHIHLVMLAQMLVLQSVHLLLQEVKDQRHLKVHKVQVVQQDLLQVHLSLDLVQPPQILHLSPLLPPPEIPTVSDPQAPPRTGLHHSPHQIDLK